MSKIVVLSLVVISIVGHSLSSVAAVAVEDEITREETVEAIRNTELKDYQAFVSSLPADIQLEIIQADLEYIKEFESKIEGMNIGTQAFEMNLHHDLIGFFVSVGVLTGLNISTFSNFLTKRYEKYVQVLDIRIDAQNRALSTYSNFKRDIVARANIQAELRSLTKNKEVATKRLSRLAKIIRRTSLGGFGKTAATKFLKGSIYSIVNIGSAFTSMYFSVQTITDFVVLTVQQTQVMQIKAAIADSKARIEITKANLETEQLEADLK